MIKRLTSVLWFLAPSLLFAFNDEILSLLALSIMGIMVIGGIIMAREAM